MSGSEQDKELLSLFRVRRTVWQLLHDRGYVVPEEELYEEKNIERKSGSNKDSSFEEFKLRFKDKISDEKELAIYAEKPDTSSSGSGDAMDESGIIDDSKASLALSSTPSNRKIVVFFVMQDKLGIEPIKNYFSRMKDLNIHYAILVLRKAITSYARNALSALAKPTAAKQLPRFFEVFEREELMINITRHVFVPKHQLLSEKEKDELLKKYKLQETQLPRIQSIDPIARYYGLKRGQVLKIIRPSETAGRYVTYRIVM